VGILFIGKDFRWQLSTVAVEKQSTAVIRAKKAWLNPRTLTNYRAALAPTAVSLSIAVDTSGLRVDTSGEHLGRDGARGACCGERAFDPDSHRQ
jgi:hypothetical protein